MRISAAGCCLIDYLYREVPYTGDAFKSCLSRNPGDGGIIEGGLVFAEDLERFSGKSFSAVCRELVGDVLPDTVNLGGPAIVAAVNAAQILEGSGVECTFYGAIGDDGVGEDIISFVGKTPVVPEFRIVEGISSSSTMVLADPEAHGGKGERSFINTIGAAGFFAGEHLPDSFFASDIVLIGGTGLVPALHDDLGTVLPRAKAGGAVTIVGTVYDFRNQKLRPDERWPLGGEEAYANMDLLVTDAEEALRLTGASTLKGAAEQFMTWKTGAFIITHGSKNYLLWSSGDFYAPVALSEFPVSARVDELLAADPSLKGDTTGCGDNFLGGLTASTAMQMIGTAGKSAPDLKEAAAWAAASGGFACFYRGGTYHETGEGEKRARLEPLVEAYRRQIGAGA
jgi:sugar/nucleoside kinase (ribokinase family)